MDNTLAHNLRISFLNKAHTAKTSIPKASKLMANPHNMASNHMAQPTPTLRLKVIEDSWGR